MEADVASFVDGESFVASEPADESEGPASDDESDPVVSAAAMPGAVRNGGTDPQCHRQPTDTADERRRRDGDDLPSVIARRGRRNAGVITWHRH